MEIFSLMKPANLKYRINLYIHYQDLILHLYFHISCSEKEHREKIGMDTFLACFMIRNSCLICYNSNLILELCFLYNCLNSRDVWLHFVSATTLNNTLTFNTDNISFYKRNLEFTGMKLIDLIVKIFVKYGVNELSYLK